MSRDRQPPINRRRPRDAASVDGIEQATFGAQRLLDSRGHVQADTFRSRLFRARRLLYQTGRTGGIFSPLGGAIHLGPSIVCLFGYAIAMVHLLESTWQWPCQRRAATGLDNVRHFLNPVRP